MIAIQQCSANVFAEDATVLVLSLVDLAFRRRRCDFLKVVAGLATIWPPCEGLNTGREQQRQPAHSCFILIVVSHGTLGVWYQANGGNDAPNGSGQKSLRHTRFRTTAVPSLSVMPGLVRGAFV